jgi:serine/threonine-protein kinase
VQICPTCSAQLDDNARFCPKDGTTIRPDSVLIPVDGASAPAFRPTVPMQPIGDKARRKKISSATADPAADPMIGRVLDGRYHIRARLGQGGVGAVYEGEHVQIKKTVAVKVLHPLYASTEEFRKRFEREARAASRLSHPACVQVMDFGRVEKVVPSDEQLIGTPYLVMEFVRGQVLIDRLIEGPRVEPAEAVAIARDLLAALRHAHGLGIVHRDVKPANVMLVEAEHETSSRVKLLDFGLAKELLNEATTEALTQAGMVFGTPGYLSPEQAAGRKVDARTDLYSLGVVLFEMCCARRLFDRQDPLDAVRDHLNTPPPDPRSLNPGISQTLAKTILKALEKDPDKRYRTAEEFAQALAECPEAGGAPEKRSVPVWTVWTRRWLGRPAWQWAAAAVALALASGMVAIASSGRTHAPAPHPAVSLPESAPAGARSDGAERAFALLGAGRTDESMRVARDALRRDARDAWSRVALANAYAQKLWCSDALEELERALQDQPELRERPETVRPAMSCSSVKNPEARRRAQKLLDRLPR